MINKHQHQKLSSCLFWDHKPNCVVCVYNPSNHNSNIIVTRSEGWYSGQLSSLLNPMRKRTIWQANRDAIQPAKQQFVLQPWSPKHKWSRAMSHRGRNEEAANPEVFCQPSNLSNKSNEKPWNCILVNMALVPFHRSGTVASFRNKCVITCLFWKAARIPKNVQSI